MLLGCLVYTVVQVQLHPERNLVGVLALAVEPDRHEVPVADAHEFGLILDHVAGDRLHRLQPALVPQLAPDSGRQITVISGGQSQHGNPGARPGV